MTEKLNHARVPRRFYILMLLIFVPIFYCLLAIRAHWYGWAIAVVAFAGLVAIRRSRFWRGWHAPLCFTLAFLAAYAGLSPQPAPMGRIPAGADWRGHGVAVYPSARGRGSDGRHDGTVGMATAGRIPYGNRAAPGKHHGGADA